MGRHARLLALVLLSLTCELAWCERGLHYYWPRFRRAETVLTAKPVSTRDAAMALDTLSGLVAREVMQGRGKELIWTPIGHPSYVRWFTMMLAQTGAREEGTFETWELVKRFQDRGVVKGHILYRYDESSRGFFEPGEMDVSVNAATSLCALYHAIAVSEKLEPDAKALGLPLLLDARGMSEEECYARYKDRFNRTIVALQDPKANEIRSEAVALGSMVLSRPGPLYEEVLAGLNLDTPVLGWAVGDEMEITKPATVLGHFITATNWCHNLPALSTETLGRSYPGAKLRQATRSIWDLSWDEDVHYAAFVMSDGDNVQWLMGDFVEDQWKCYWSNLHRGAFPIGWTCCYVDLAQLCPYTIEYLFNTATRQDDFVLFGGGYYYPDLFASRRPESRALQTHARRIADYMRLGGIRVLAVNCDRWDSDAALDAYATYAREIPNLLAVLAIQYAPYTAGGGAVKWVKDSEGRDLPVISARFSIWNNVNSPRDDSPTVIASHLNELPHAGAPTDEEHFSWVIVHAWSWFKPPQLGAPPDAEEIDQKLGGQPGTGRGLDATKWCVDALQPHVKVVTPTDLVLLMRLRLRPEETLKAALEDLGTAVKRAHGQIRSEAATQLGLARERLAQKDYAACFQAAQEADRLIAGSSSEGS